MVNINGKQYYTQEEVDAAKAALDKAVSDFDQAKKNEMYARAQDIVWEEMPIIPLMEQDNTWAEKSNLVDIKIYPDGAINVRNAKIAQ